MENKNISIGIIGHFGGKRVFTDGQTVKTKSVYNGLIRAGYTNIAYADTYFIKRNPVRFIYQFCLTIKRSKKIIVLLSKRGRGILFPFLQRMNQKKDIYHYAIGGNISKEARISSKFYKQISLFKYNWVESNIIKEELNGIGIQNARYIPNFKCISKISKDELNYSFEMPIPFCTFSRVVFEKGIEDAIDAINKVNNIFMKNVVRLDIYGPISPNYSKRFQNILDKNKNNLIRYCGIISPDQSVATLKKYYMLLFPSFWNAEGMPGTIIDALFSGLPVIAREWKFCQELIENNITGYIYDHDKPEELYKLIIKSIQDAESIKRMRNNCLNLKEKLIEKIF